MSQLGLGVMINMLTFDNSDKEAFQKALNKTITKIELSTDDCLYISFNDNTCIKIWDNGQSCCESRYMRTDDNLSDFIGATLLGAEIKDAPNIPDNDSWGEHEVQFLEIKTSKGSFTMASHNEHNGYYGGFSIRVEGI